MISFIEKKHTSLTYQILSGLVTFTFLFTCILPPTLSHAQAIQTVLNLPVPGTMVGVSNAYMPTLIKGLTVHPDNPLKFNFIVDTGDSMIDGDQLVEESEKLIKYFLASLTVPEKEMWVNLSPTEKDRIISDGFGQTEMGRDLLAQDYILKQLTSTLVYPEDELGKKFWDEVYKKANDQFGSTDIPLDSLSKVWIVPEKAVVYEEGLNAFVIGSKLKIMMERDYFNGDKGQEARDKGNSLNSNIIKEIIIPAITKEVNEGRNFAPLRQIYNSMILAAWYKQNLKNSLLGQIYVDKNKTKGVDHKQNGINQEIYDQYIEAFKTGVYNYIKEDYDPKTGAMTPKKYFSGGGQFGNLSSEQVLSTVKEGEVPSKDKPMVTAGVRPSSSFSKTHDMEVDLYEHTENNADLAALAEPETKNDNAMVGWDEFINSFELAVEQKVHLSAVGQRHAVTAILIRASAKANRPYNFRLSGAATDLLPGGGFLDEETIDSLRQLILSAKLDVEETKLVFVIRLSLGRNGIPFEGFSIIENFERAAGMAGEPLATKLIAIMPRSSEDLKKMFSRVAEIVEEPHKSDLLNIIKIIPEDLEDFQGDNTLKVFLDTLYYAMHSLQPRPKSSRDQAMIAKLQRASAEKIREALAAGLSGQIVDSELHKFLIAVCSKDDNFDTGELNVPALNFILGKILQLSGTEKRKRNLSPIIIDKWLLREDIFGGFLYMLEPGSKLKMKADGFVATLNDISNALRVRPYISKEDIDEIFGSKDSMHSVYDAFLMLDKIIDSVHTLEDWLGWKNLLAANEAEDFKIDTNQQPALPLEAIETEDEEMLTDALTEIDRIMGTEGGKNSVKKFALIDLINKVSIAIAGRSSTIIAIGDRLGTPIELDESPIPQEDIATLKGVIQAEIADQAMTASLVIYDAIEAAEAEGYSGQITDAKFYKELYVLLSPVLGEVGIEQLFASFVSLRKFIERTIIKNVKNDPEYIKLLKRTRKRTFSPISSTKFAVMRLKMTENIKRLKRAALFSEDLMSKDLLKYAFSRTKGSKAALLSLCLSLMGISYSYETSIEGYSEKEIKERVATIYTQSMHENLANITRILPKDISALAFVNSFSELYSLKRSPDKDRNMFSISPIFIHSLVSSLLDDPEKMPKALYTIDELVESLLHNKSGEEAVILAIIDVARKLNKGESTPLLDEYVDDHITLAITLELMEANGMHTEELERELEENYNISKKETARGLNKMIEKRDIFLNGETYYQLIEPKVFDQAMTTREQDSMMTPEQIKEARREARYKKLLAEREEEQNRKHAERMRKKDKAMTAGAGKRNLETVKVIIREVLEMGEDEKIPQDETLDSIGGDSLDSVNIASRVEEEFDLKEDSIATNMQLHLDPIRVFYGLIEKAGVELVYSDEIKIDSEEVKDAINDVVVASLSVPVGRGEESIPTDQWIVEMNRIQNETIEKLETAYSGLIKGGNPLGKNNKTTAKNRVRRLALAWQKIVKGLPEVGSLFYSANINYLLNKLTLKNTSSITDIDRLVEFKKEFIHEIKVAVAGRILKIYDGSLLRTPAEMQGKVNLMPGYPWFSLERTEGGLKIVNENPSGEFSKNSVKATEIILGIFEVLTKPPASLWFGPDTVLESDLIHELDIVIDEAMTAVETKEITENILHAMEESSILLYRGYGIPLISFDKGDENAEKEADRYLVFIERLLPLSIKAETTKFEMGNKIIVGFKYKGNVIGRALNHGIYGIKEEVENIKKKLNELNSKAREESSDFDSRIELQSEDTILLGKRKWKGVLRRIAEIINETSSYNFDIEDFASGEEEILETEINWAQFRSSMLYEISGELRINIFSHSVFESNVKTFGDLQSVLLKFTVKAVAAKMVQGLEISALRLEENNLDALGIDSLDFLSVFAVLELKFSADLFGSNDESTGVSLSDIYSRLRNAGILKDGGPIDSVPDERYKDYEIRAEEAERIIRSWMDDDVPFSFSAELKEDLGVDYLEKEAIINDLMETNNIEISDAETEAVKTVWDVFMLLNAKGVYLDFSEHAEFENYNIITSLLAESFDLDPRNINYDAFLDEETFGENFDAMLDKFFNDLKYDHGIHLLHAFKAQIVTIYDIYEYLASKQGKSFISPFVMKRIEGKINLEKVKKIILRSFTYTFATNLPLNSRFGTEIKADSLDVLTHIRDLEETFDVELREDRLGSNALVDFYRYLQKHGVHLDYFDEPLKADKAMTVETDAIAKPSLSREEMLALEILAENHGEMPSKALVEKLGIKYGLGSKIAQTAILGLRDKREEVQLDSSSGIISVDKAMTADEIVGSVVSDKKTKNTRKIVFESGAKFIVTPNIRDGGYAVDLHSVYGPRKGYIDSIYYVDRKPLELDPHKLIIEIFENYSMDSSREQKLKILLDETKPQYKKKLEKIDAIRTAIIELNRERLANHLSDKMRAPWLVDILKGMSKYFTDNKAITNMVSDYRTMTMLRKAGLDKARNRIRMNLERTMKKLQSATDKAMTARFQGADRTDRHLAKSDRLAAEIVALVKGREELGIPISIDILESTMSTVSDVPSTTISPIIKDLVGKSELFVDPDTKLVTTDKASLAEYGGINLDPSMMDLQIKRDANWVPLPVDQQPLLELNIEGFIPVIINITPIQSIPMFLGWAETDEGDSKEANIPAQEPADRIEKYVLKG